MHCTYTHKHTHTHREREREKEGRELFVNLLRVDTQQHMGTAQLTRTTHITTKMQSIMSASVKSSCRVAALVNWLAKKLWNSYLSSGLMESNHEYKNKKKQLTLKIAWNSCYKTDTISSEYGKNDLDIYVIKTAILPLLDNC